MKSITLPLVLIAVCNIAYTGEIEKQPAGQIWEISAQKAVRDALKDPDSARFTDLVLYKQGEVYGVCGYVNAKNSYGGYVGKKLFYVIGAKMQNEYLFFAPKIAGDDDEEEFFQEKFCHDK
jgi:hypothetical protein